MSVFQEQLEMVGTWRTLKPRGPISMSLLRYKEMGPDA